MEWIVFWIVIGIVVAVAGPLCGAASTSGMKSTGPNGSVAPTRTANAKRVGLEA